MGSAGIACARGDGGCGDGGCGDGCAVGGKTKLRLNRFGSIWMSVMESCGPLSFRARSGVKPEIVGKKKASGGSEAHSGDVAHASVTIRIRRSVTTERSSTPSGSSAMPHHPCLSPNDDVKLREMAADATAGRRTGAGGAAVCGDVET